MSSISDEMKAAANYTIKAAKEKFGQELDFSEQSIVKLENLLEQAHQSLSGRVNDEKVGISISRTANAWGSYLGEYMRLKWGGTWVLRGSERILSIKSIEFSPIKFVYQKITSHPEYSVKNYFVEAEGRLSSRPDSPSQSQNKPEGISQPKQSAITIDKKLILAIAGIGGIILITCICVAGFMIFNPGGVSTEFKTNLNAFLVEAEKLNILTEQGVSNSEFRNQLAEAKSAYSLLNNTWPSSLSAEKNSFDQAIKGWELVLEIWDLKLNSLIWLSEDSTTLKEIIQYTNSNRIYPSSISIDEWIGLLMGTAGQHFEQGRLGIESKLK